MAASTLHVLAKEDVNRICSGQSVVDLATCVKELVENALDAGATQIDVKLREYGRDGIEVSDNGGGIASANYATLALKHYTSKISAFEDIASVASFGFRGEALSSICQLVSSFTVCTRTAEEELATLLTYDRSGALVSQTKKARPVGTTIVVEDLFQPLPVRLKDFHRNIKKHYAKLLKVLQAYAVSCVRVKISVSNASSGKNSSRQVVLATQAHQSMGDNIASVFGTKFFRTMKGVEFDLNETWPVASDERASAAAKTKPRDKHIYQSSQDREAAEEDGDAEETKEDEDEEMESQETLSQNAKELQRRVVGFVSKVGEGVGRSDNDRQFFFINNRPFDLPKLAKAVNDVWRQFEMKQKPACVLNFLLPSGEFDVNVTPDKRETFLKHEGHIVESFKTRLTRLYEPSRGTFFVQPLLTAFAAPKTKEQEMPAVEKAIVDENDDEAAEENPPASHARSSVTADVVVASSQRIGGLTITFEPALPVQAAQPSEAAVSHSCCAGGSHRHDPENDVTMEEESVQRELLLDDDENHLLDKTTAASAPASGGRYLAYSTNGAREASTTDEPIEQVPKKHKPSPPTTSESTDGEVVRVLPKSSPSKAPRQLDELMGEWSFAEMKRQRETFFEQEVEIEQRRTTKARRLSISKVGHADALEPDGDLAAAALQRVLKKDDFKRMEVVGQFNLGFIIGKLDDDDLFIIDQHASDEKYNYETLQQTTVLHQQPLVRPLPLELTAAEEMVILDHLEVFTRHGFTFLVRKDAPPTRKLQLLSLPFSKHTQFGVEDIRELASLLMDAPLNPASVRLPKLMAMFASRACRSSIMIGTALHKEEMSKIVRNLATLEQPWNCPHGRPTLRHLLDIGQLDDAQQQI